MLLTRRLTGTQSTEAVHVGCRNSFVSIEISFPHKASIGLALLYRLLIFDAVTLSSLSNIPIAKTPTYIYIYI